VSFISVKGEDNAEEEEKEEEEEVDAEDIEFFENIYKDMAESKNRLKEKTKHLYNNKVINQYQHTETKGCFGKCCNKENPPGLGEDL